ncbi:TRAP transporter substrate-binding protein [Anaerococcus sp. AGMB00486]|uniref:TRAP transporter substrate-binding protein n=2 Tax=Anaerococcus TaxID=165779 RepID=A0ABX2NCE8_9FIRM|nr:MULTISPECIES: TRAP transporter substrate-binding protein [Anaerococcus]MSS78422.1 TRAP transporter substrate-binding protein [Anaerococcus porci]NVF12396.1 TRAP transporter substrate-binding protein [Anaerococcus faecalis]
MNKKLKTIILSLLMVLILASCSSNEKESKIIVRVGHNQSQKHPTHLGLLEFEKYVEGKLGDKYDIQVFPSELLGSQTDMVQLTQTGAIDICVASNAILETFDDVYEIFNLPYLFASEESYHKVMDDKSITDPIFSSTKEGGFVGVTWLDAGSRSFYTKNTRIEKPEDLKGLKIRVQQSPTNVKMMDMFGASASPMGFGEVYTALQSGIIDGAENNEMSLTDNGHGEICKYYSYDMHQMVPDIVIANYDWLENMPKEDRKVFEEGFEVLSKAQRKEWKSAVENAKQKAAEMGVEFIYPDQKPFSDAVEPLKEEVISRNEKLKPYYEKIKEYNEKYPAKEDNK